MIPVKYTVRNLQARWVTTLLTAAGTGLVVWASVLSFGLAQGLETALLISADALDVVCLRKGSLDEVSSGIDKQTADRVATLQGIATDNEGRPLCSEEYVITLLKPRRGDGGTTNLTVRGLKEVGHRLRPGFKIVEGRDLSPGHNEAITSRRIAERFADTAIGEALTINNVKFRVVGYFEASGCAAESEVWTDVRDLTTVRKSQAVVSSVTFRAPDVVTQQALIEQIKEDEQFNLKAMTEEEFFKDQMASAQVVQALGTFIAIFLTIGAMFAAANTMYAAVAGRAREIGTLRALGFSRTSILLSFLLESIVLCLLGGLLGCLATVPFNGYSTGMANFQTFNEITFSFRFCPIVLLEGVLMAMTMGVLGVLFPAVRAVRMSIIQALREL
ncbi:MAG: ABC transporter permease [Planctomycetes bacterium]|nr:ABC transporter permease [Planctomycetota bacterium]